MRFIAIVNYKGGVAKTSSAVHIAAALTEMGERVLVVDGDVNRSALKWAERAREAGAPLPFVVVPERGAVRAIPESQPTVVIIDTAARPSEADLREIAEGAETVIVPTTCDQLALEQSAATLRALQQLDVAQPPRLVALLTRVPPAPRRDGDDAEAALSAGGVSVVGRIPELVVFQRAAEQGTLAGLVRRDPQAARRAADAYAAVAASIIPQSAQSAQSAHA